MGYPGSVGWHIWIDNATSLAVVTREGEISRLDISRNQLTPITTGAAIDQLAGTPSGRQWVAISNQRRVLLGIDKGSGQWSTKAIFDLGHSKQDYFVADPAISESLGLVAFRYWEDVTMPWYQSYIKLVDFEGNLRRTIGLEGEMVSQPRFSPDGQRLAYISSATGYLSLTVIKEPFSGHPRSITSNGFDYGDVDLGTGQASYCWATGSDGLFALRNEDGFARVVLVDLEQGGVGQEVAKGFLDAPVTIGSSLLGIRQGARTPTHIACIETAPISRGDSSSKRRLVAGHFFGASLTSLVEPEILRTETPSIELGNAKFPATEMISRLYRSQLSEAFGTLVLLHGGPTGQTGVRFNHRIGFYNSIGIDVLVPDFRGTSGHGIAFARALAGGWGIVDVSDVRSAIAAASRNGALRADAVVMGSSAGGYLSLRLAQDPLAPIVGAIAIAPVVDLSATAATTHRFESHYTDILVGPRRHFDAEWTSRSPASHPDALRVPILVIQGDSDEVVPAKPSTEFIAALLARGKQAKYVLIEGEGHSWKHDSSLITETEAILAFLRDDCHWNI